MKKKEEVNHVEVIKGGILDLAIDCKIVNGKPVWITELDTKVYRDRVDVMVCHELLLSKLPPDFPQRKDCIYYLGNGTERNNRQALKTWVCGVFSGEIDLPENGMKGLELLYEALVRTLEGDW